MKSKLQWLSGLLVLCSLTLMLSCKDDKKEEDHDDDEDNNSGARPLYMNKLQLTTDQFDTLKNYQGNQLVFQFFYPGTATLQSPTLYAYAMQSGNKATGKPPVQLTYGAVSKEPFTGRSQVLGDQQILVKTLEDLLKQVEGGYQGKNLYFLFSPVFIGDNPHMAYEVTVEGSNNNMDQSARTNPSPPASAY